MTAAAKLPLSAAVAVAPGRWVRGCLVYPIWGLSIEAARKYRERGYWLEGKHWKRDAVGQLVYNREAIDNWFETEQ